LSGLLVKSAQMMVVTAQDLRSAGVSCPILVGGAALSNRFTRLKIAPEYDGVVAYANDAMTGLDLANQVVDAVRRGDLSARLAQESEVLRGDAERRAATAPTAPVRKASVRQDHDVPTPPDLKLHVLKDYDLDAIFAYINPVMLYTRHLGFKGKFAEALARGDARAVELHGHVREVEDVMLGYPDIQARAVFKFFRAGSEGETLHILTPDGSRTLESFHFGRQTVNDGLCLADYTLPLGDARPDYVAMFATTVGPGVRALAEEWKAAGQYLRSHILQVLALESAEAFAELLHQKIREMWRIPDAPGTAVGDLFKVRYRGVRVSFGYPACPRLEDQVQLFRLLDVEQQIGVHLTEGFMMEPEGSVTALVFHHPDAKYFSLSPEDAARLERAAEEGERIGA
jgi:5-methyltetrahydrofolate--homocysteine methyltransferase